MKLQGYKHGKPFEFEAISIGTDTNGRPGFMERAAGNAFLRMRADAKADGVNLEFTTAFRDHDFQVRLWESYLQATKVYADASMRVPGAQGFYDGYVEWCLELKLEPHELVAKPGWSNHQQGTTIDIPVNGAKRARVYGWLVARARGYGFYKTVASERWHWEWRLS